MSQGQEFNDELFENQTVRLDRNKYTSCQFKNCKIEFGGMGAVGLNACSFEACQWNFVEAADTTFGFLHSIYHGMGESGVQLVESMFEAIRKKG